MPIAIRLAPCPRASKSRRRRMSITVTIRPRRLSRPATSGAASGTAVRGSGMNTSCTREIGRPNNWPPMVAVTYSMTVSLIAVVRSCRVIDVGGLFFERRNQARAVELADVVVEADPFAALDRLDGDQRGKTDHRHIR